VQDCHCTRLELQRDFPPVDRQLAPGEEVRDGCRTVGRPDSRARPPKLQVEYEQQAPAGTRAAHERDDAVSGDSDRRLDAALRRDYPVVMGLIVVTFVFVVITNLVTDLIYMRLDPRISFARSAANR